MHWTKHNSWHAGHIVADVKGGSPTANNLVPICPSCNSEQGDEDMRDFVKKRYPNNYSRFMAILKVHDTNNDEILFEEIRNKLWNTQYCVKEYSGHIGQYTYFCCSCDEYMFTVQQNLKDKSYIYIKTHDTNPDIYNSEDLHQIVLTHYPCIANS